MSKKVSAALTALSTALLVTGLSITGLPIILLPTLAALGTQAQETRVEQLKEKTKLVENQLTNNYEYDSKISNISLTTPTINNQQLSYTPPSPIEIVKAGLDITLTGLLTGIVSVGFMTKMASYSISAYSEVKIYHKIKSLNEQLKDLKEQLKDFQIQILKDETKTSKKSNFKSSSKWTSKFPKPSNLKNGKTKLNPLKTSLRLSNKKYRLIIEIDKVF